MHRFTLIALLLAAANTFAAETLNRWAFEVQLDGKPIGTHTFEKRLEQGATRIQSEAEFAVKLLFVTVFDYAHQNQELWSQNCLRRFEAVTETRGKTIRASGQQNPDAFLALADGTPTQIEADCLKTFAYWNPSILQETRLLNPQTGLVEPVKITFDGEERISTPEGELLANVHTLALEETNIRVWHQTGTERWLALESELSGGRQLRYQPTLLPPNN